MADREAGAVGGGANGEGGADRERGSDREGGADRDGWAGRDGGAGREGGADRDGERALRWAMEMPLLNLIDDICTTGEEITTSQLDRIQQYLTGEHGCSADELTKFKKPLLFFAFLREKKFISFANLAFLQAVLTRIGRDDLCDIVSKFARKHSDDALYLEYSNIHEGGNARVNLHVRKTLTKRNEVDQIVKSLASCLDIPPESIRVMGAEVTNSYRLTLYIPAKYRDRLADKSKLNHLTEVDIDEVEVDGETIKLTPENRSKETHVI